MSRPSAEATGREARAAARAGATQVQGIRARRRRPRAAERGTVAGGMTGGLGPTESLSGVRLPPTAGGAKSYRTVS